MDPRPLHPPLNRDGRTVEALNQRMPASLQQHLGVHYTALTETTLAGRMPVDARTQQDFGMLHGGATVALAETLGSVAANLALQDPDHRCVGLNLSASHLRAATQGWVEGTARAIHVGRMTHLWEIEVRDQDGHLIHVCRLTMAVLKRQDHPWMPPRTDEAFR